MSEKRQSGPHRPSTPTPLQTRSKTRLRTMSLNGRGSYHPDDDGDPFVSPTGGATGTTADENPAPSGRVISPSSEGHSDQRRGADSHPNDPPDNEPATNELIDSYNKTLEFLNPHQRLTFVNHLYNIHRPFSQPSFLILLLLLKV